MTACDSSLDTLREQLLQCHAVNSESEAMRFALKTIEDVRQGKYPDTDIDADTKTNARKKGVHVNKKLKARSQVVDKSIPNHATQTRTKVKTRTSLTKGFWRRIIIPVMRFIVVELPLVFIFAMGVGTHLLSHVHTTYLDPQFDLMTYTDENRTADRTFYHRECLSEDITAQTPEELYIHEDFNTQDKVDHILTHGMSIYPNILRQETATNLRSWVLNRNKALSAKDEIDVISNENRWSFYIGANDDPLVSDALNQVATHEVFRPALEKIVGRNPAIIEMTAITSAFGAEDQFWHHDIIGDGSPAKYARSFIPSYSLFMTLQDTTAAMGATDLCPGTHMCGSADSDSVCAGHSFQASGGTVWKRGDALFMNQQTFHRGAAHKDPNGPHRVLFIVTFAPRPMDMLYETRLLGQGGSYSLRWDMWGHVLDDYEHAPTKMRQPWTTLRGLGLYKPKESEWGWDWVSQTSMRIANGDTGYYDENLDDFVAKGAFGLPKMFAPKLLDEMGWRDYIQETVLLWKETMTKINVVCYSIYVMLSFLSGIVLYFIGQQSESRKAPLHSVFRSFRRIAALNFVFIAIYLGILHSVNESSWAKAIRSKTLYTSPFSATELPEDQRPLAVISKNDVLLTDRYDVKYLGSLTEVVEFHAGNMKYRSMIKGASEMAKSRNNTEVVDELAHNILRGIRLLFQNEFTDWVVLSQSDSIKYTTQALLLEANPLIAALHKEYRYLLSSYKHGLKYRNSSTLARKHGVVNLNAFMTRLMATKGIPFFSLYDSPIFPTKKRLGKRTTQQPQYKIRGCAEFNKHKKVGQLKRNYQLLSSSENIPQEGMQIGDYVDAMYNGMHNEYFKGKIVGIRQGSEVDVEYMDGEMDEGLAPHHVEHFVPYAIGHKVQAKISVDAEFKPAEILEVIPHGKVVVKFSSRGGKIAKVKETWIRRVKEAEIGDIVECPFEGSEELFKGTVLRRNRDDTYHVKFFDGDEDYHVKASDMMIK